MGWRVAAGEGMVGMPVGAGMYACMLAWHPPSKSKSSLKPSLPPRPPPLTWASFSICSCARHKCGQHEQGHGPAAPHRPSVKAEPNVAYDCGLVEEGRGRGIKREGRGGACVPAHWLVTLRW